MRRKTALIVWGLIAAVIVALIILSTISGLIERWLWMRQLGYQGIFWRILTMQWALFGVAFIGVFLYVGINLRLALRRIFVLRGSDSEQGRALYAPDGTRITSAFTTGANLIVSGIFALIFALIFYSEWDTWIRFRWGEAFGKTDPIFNADIGFYVFRLPFFELIQNGLAWLTFFTLLIVLITYVLLGVFESEEGWPAQRSRPVTAHLSVLFLFFVGSWAWGFYLDRFELLYSNIGIVYGVGYTADHVNRISLWVMMFASGVLAVLVLVNLFTWRAGILLTSVGAYFLLYFVALVVVPGLVQKFEVDPSELELETPYLKHNIALTRQAYQLDLIEEKTYPALTDLTLEDISDNPETINNIRLWDWRPLLQTYRQTQEIRLYYEFYDVDVGRYHMQDGYHQVMLSARELAAELPEKARTWVNEYLQFTHGYGLVMNFVSEKNPEGFPVYVIENIPPVASFGLPVDQPAVYYGENTPGYRMVSTKIKEFDYPKGSKNVYTSYQGKGGIPIGSFWKKVLFAWTQSDINILLTSYLDSGSRIQIWRRVHERVGKVAPFLKLDKDPYLVLSKGRLYWIQDAYTTSDRYPYSEPYIKAFEAINYIRNSVKAVVDIYDGSVRFYVIDPQDPVIRAYRKAFPGVFRDLSELSPDLKAHLRYPQDLFAIQVDQYRTYHMVDPQVFYNQEDLWTFPQEKYAGTAIPLEPYYILMRLPDTQELQYLLMTPFTPQNRDNMIAWMAAKCDFPEYGEVIVYQLPKERLTLGPIQIEAMIDQNTAISQQLSLWDQRGSRVIRGNLIVIPIHNSFLYVEPVYLTAEGTNIPQLKRIIVVSGNKVVMEPTLEEALKALFGAARPEEKKIAAPAQLEELDKARDALEKAQKALRQGNWQAFGDAMEKLKNTLSPGQ
jgi:uncharacterized membrane protein (UPF0182 family)